MRKTGLMIGFIMLLLPAALLSALPGDSIAFETADLDGSKVTEALFADNRVTMVNIWGTFCPPCIREMPDLGRLSADYKAKGVQIVGVVIDALDRYGRVDDKIKADARKIIDKTKADYLHVVPTVAMFSGLLKDVQAVPTTIFVDSKGHQIGEAYLGSRSYKDWKKIIDSILEVAD